MEKQHLRDLLQQVHSELDRTESMDPESRRLLRGLMDDIHKTLEEGKDEEETALHTFREDLENSARQFEVRHPTITAAIVQLIDALPK